MRDNIILLMVVLIFVAGYFIFTSKINHDKFTEIVNTSLHPYVLVEKVSNTHNNIIKQLKDDFF
jgi:uncharacterized protein YxeA